MPEGAPLPLEIWLVWLLFVLDAVAILVTYSRMPARELYHVSHSGLAGGLSRVLVFSNYSTALVAIAVLAVVADRRAEAVVALVGVVLCAGVFWPGVVDQANLDAKPANALAGVGVLIALVLSLLRVGRPRWAEGQSGDRARVVVAAAAIAFGLPWIAAELGFFLDGVPLLGWLFETGKHLPTTAAPPAVHHGHHHGMDGVLLLVSAVLISRVAPSVRRGWLRSALGAYLALMACYGTANLANDFWGEQVWKRGWTSWRIPGVLRPSLSVAWGVIVLGTVALYALAVWWNGRRVEAAPASAQTQ
ncbi:MAG TPA: hypothetical protein VF101_09875 [Gaiellaceae bacterium]